MAKDGHRHPSFDEARNARSTAEFAVLMAPAAASMDQFTSYADRGTAFIHAVARLMDSKGLGS